MLNVQRREEKKQRVWMWLEWPDDLSRQDLTASLMGGVQSYLKQDALISDEPQIDSLTKLVQDWLQKLTTKPDHQLLQDIKMWQEAPGLLGAQESVNVLRSCIQAWLHRIIVDDLLSLVADELGRDVWKTLHPPSGDRRTRQPEGGGHDKKPYFKHLYQLLTADPVVERGVLISATEWWREKRAAGQFEDMEGCLKRCADQAAELILFPRLANLKDNDPELKDDDPEWLALLSRIIKHVAWPHFPKYVSAHTKYHHILWNLRKPLSEDEEGWDRLNSYVLAVIQGARNANKGEGFQFQSDQSPSSVSLAIAKAVDFVCGACCLYEIGRSISIGTEGESEAIETEDMASSKADSDEKEPEKESIRRLRLWRDESWSRLKKSFDNEDDLIKYWVLRELRLRLIQDWDGIADPEPFVFQPTCGILRSGDLPRSITSPQSVEWEDVGKAFQPLYKLYKDQSQKAAVTTIQAQAETRRRLAEEMKVICSAGGESLQQLAHIETGEGSAVITDRENAILQWTLSNLKERVKSERAKKKPVSRHKNSKCMICLVLSNEGSVDCDWHYIAAPPSLVLQPRWGILSHIVLPPGAGWDSVRQLFQAMADRSRSIPGKLTDDALKKLFNRANTLLRELIWSNIRKALADQDPAAATRLYVLHRLTRDRWEKEYHLQVDPQKLWKEVAKMVQTSEYKKSEKGLRDEDLPPGITLDEIQDSFQTMKAEAEDDAKRTGTDLVDVLAEALQRFYARSLSHVQKYNRNHP